MQSYKKVFKTKRLHLKPLFEDFDITKIGYVTKNQFTRLLKQYDLIPNNEQQFNLVLKKYMDKGNLNEVNYYQFIRDIDEYNEDSKAISQLRRLIRRLQEEAQAQQCDHLQRASKRFGRFAGEIRKKSQGRKNQAVGLPQGFR